jgi:thioesterase domain-containing protein
MLTRSAIQARERTYVKPRIHVDSITSLESVYHRLIPISKHMGIRVVAFDGERLTLEAPLENNINHQQSAFGGSLFSVAALAGWGLMQLKLCELGLDCDTVIAGGNVSYRRPVFADFSCTCELPPGWQAFVDRLKGEGKASTELAARIDVGGKPAMALTGTYVVTDKGRGER